MTLPNANGFAASLSGERSPVEKTFSLDDLCHRLQASLGDKRYEMWFTRQIHFSLTGSSLRVEVASALMLGWLRGQFQSLLEQHAQALGGDKLTVEWCLANHQPDAANRHQPRMTEVHSPGTPKPREPYKLPSQSNTSDVIRLVNPSAETSPSNGAMGLARKTSETILASSKSLGTYPSTTQIDSSNGGNEIQRARRYADFSEFVVGPSNQMAARAAQLAAQEDHSGFNPLYIYASVGLGKTHLLQAICKERRRLFSNRSALYLTAEGFTNAFTQALRDKATPGFRLKFRSVDLLLVDDIDFFECTKAVQEEFLHTIDDLIHRGGKVVVTSSRHPRMLTKLTDELSNRLQSGLVSRLEAPELETRLAIVKKRVLLAGAEVSTDVQNYVAQRFPRNVRELEGAVNCLVGHTSLAGKRLSLSAAREILADLERDCVRFVRLIDVEQVICQVFGLRPKDLKSDSRARSLSQPRMLAMYLARKHTGAAYAEIGEHFGGRNHSTVISAEKKVSDWMEANSEVKAVGQSWKLADLLAVLEQRLIAG